MTVTFQEWIWKALEDATMTIYSEVSTFRIMQDINILTFEPFANKEGLAEQMHIAMFSDLTVEGDSSSGNGKQLMRNRVIGWQFSKFGAPAKLHGRQAAQARLSMLRVNGLFQMMQFAFESTDLRIVTME